ncbi:MAG: beta-lactamase family protein [Armatimonadetes bacterium]|nr:beta-lactamase family protein [Armatimonadota bacterium]
MPFLAPLVFLVAQAPSQAEIDKIITSMLEKTKTPSASVIVTQNGKTLYRKSFGFANLEWKAKATPTTKYRLASVTKQFTAMLIMRQVEKGNLNLFAPVKTILPDWPKAWDGVTVQHLLTHTSGIPEYTEGIEFAFTMRKDQSWSSIVESVAKKPVKFAPGAEWSYCNTGYLTLGLILEKVSGKKYAELLQSEIYDPLGMKQSTVMDDGRVTPEMASGYTVVNGVLKPSVYISATQPGSAGYLISTVDDLAKWLQALDQGKLISKASYAEMWRPVRLTTGKNHPYGFGWGIELARGHRILHHSGGIPGFSTFVMELPDDHMQIAVLTNSNDGEPEVTARQIVGKFIPELDSEKIASVPSTPAERERVQKLVRYLASGEWPEGFMTPKMSEEMTKIKAQVMASVKSFGKPSNFELLERKGQPGGREAQDWRITCEKVILILKVSVDPDGKVAGALVSSVVPK